MLQITELDDDKTYKYLDMDENIAYQGSLNKERVIKEYTNRVRKIWKSDLNTRNKVVGSTQLICCTHFDAYFRNFKLE